MIAVDTNILVYAHRTDSEWHDRAASRLRGLAEGRAAWALRHDGASVARAAEIAGYASQANFSTAFRRHFGQPPKTYRARV